MSKIIAIHSFRQGTGKTTLTANLAALLAIGGQRVGILDGDIPNPSAHLLFNLPESALQYSLDDYLWGRCEIAQAAHDVTSRLGDSVAGKIFLLPSRIRPETIGYDIGLMSDSFTRLVEALELDVLLIDSHAGLTDETLPSLAICDIHVIILRPDERDFQGTAVTLDVAHQLDVPCLLLIVNLVPATFLLSEVKAQVAATYGCEVIAVLPHADHLMALASADLFVLRYPADPISTALIHTAARLME